MDEFATVATTGVRAGVALIGGCDRGAIAGVWFVAATGVGARTGAEASAGAGADIGAGVGA